MKAAKPEKIFCMRRSDIFRVYYLFLPVFSLLLLASCHSSKSVTNKAHSGYDRTEIHVGKGNSFQHRLIEEAYTWMGTPYKYAGLSKGKGVDCSGMVMRVYEDVAGRKLPRNSARQAEWCETIDAKDIEMGDLVFFATGKDPDRVSHVGMIVDDDSFIHASSSKGVVVSKLSNPYYMRTFIKFGRVPRKSLSGD